MIFEKNYYYKKKKSFIEFIHENENINVREIKQKKRKQINSVESVLSSIMI